MNSILKFPEPPRKLTRREQLMATLSQVKEQKEPIYRAQNMQGAK